MEIDVMGDLITFLISILCGLFMGTLFDFYRTFRSFSNPKGILSYVEDILFWIVIGVIFFALLVNTTDGVLRGFVFIGVFCGVIIYMLLLSRWILSLFTLIFKLIYEVFSEIIGVIKKPFRKIRLFIKTYFKEMSRYSKMIFKKK